MHESRRRKTRGRLAAVLVTFTLVAAACGGSDGESATTDATQTTEAAPVETETPDTAPVETDTPVEAEPESSDSTPPEEAPANTEPSDEEAVATSAAFPGLGPATGEPMRVALVNSEGSAGLDFPDIRENVGATVDYLNEHGGFGGRPIEIVNCTVNGSPEASQGCAQEVTGQGVELVLLGLDLFPDYPTYTAAGVPVIGMLPILPADYTANALFLTGGNATTMGAMANAALNHFGASNVAIISADNAGANASEIALTASLDVAGISYTTVKGGDNETDAGFQGLMREAASGEPDLLISLYADAGCVGTMRGRAALDIDIPVLTTSICADASVIEQVGDEAVGWSFVGIQTDELTPERAILQEMLAPALGVDPDQVDPNALGLGGLGAVMMMSLAVYSIGVADDGGDVTGTSLYDYMASAPGLVQWPSGALVECGVSRDYPSICAFTFPIAEYQAGGGVLTIPGLEAVSSIDYLP